MWFTNLQKSSHMSFKQSYGLRMNTSHETLRITLLGTTAERSNLYRLCTVYPKKYAHGFCFAVLCCGYTLTDFPISIRLTSLALWQSDDCPSANKATLMNMDKYFIWIHYERLHNHNKAKHNKTVCIFLGIYCSVCFGHVLKSLLPTSNIEEMVQMKAFPIGKQRPSIPWITNEDLFLIPEKPAGLFDISLPSETTALTLVR